MTRIRVVAKHMVWAAVGNWGERVTTLIVFVVLARLLPPSQIGALAYFNAIVAMVQIVADGAVSEWLVRNHNSSYNEEAGIFTFQTIIGIICAICLSIFGFSLGPYLTGRADAGLIMASLSIVIPLGCMAAVPQAMLRRTFRFEQMAYRSLSALVLGGIAGVGLAFCGFGIWSLVIKQIVEAFIFFLVTLRTAAWIPSFRWKPREIDEALRFAKGMLGAWIFEAISLRIDSLVVGTILGATALGYYSVGLRISQVLLSLFVGIFDRVSFSHFASLTAMPEELSNLYLRLLQMSTRLFAPIISIAIGAAPVLIPFILGSKWTTAWPAAQFLWLVPLVTTATVFNLPILQANGMPERAMQITLASAAMTFVGSTVGCMFGITGASIGTASQVLLIAPLGFFMIKPIVGLSWRALLRILLPGIFASVAAIICSRAVLDLSTDMLAIVRLSLASLSGAVGAYLALITLVGRNPFSDAKLLSRAVDVQ